MRILKVGGGGARCAPGSPYSGAGLGRAWGVPGSPSGLSVIAPWDETFPSFSTRKRGEYALARTERKVREGHRGFTFHTAPDVTLEADLARRDLTINAMAVDEEGVLIDPLWGIKAIFSVEYSVMFPQLSRKIPCGYCAWRVSPPSWRPCASPWRQRPRPSWSPWPEAESWKACPGSDAGASLRRLWR